jgi:hypothetical protein
MHTPAPTLSCSDESGPARPITLVVYAPFADDATLSTYPDSTTTEVSEHPLYAALQGVADQGVERGEEACPTWHPSASQHPAPNMCVSCQGHATYAHSIKSVVCQLTHPPS